MYSGYLYRGLTTNTFTFLKRKSIVPTYKDNNINYTSIKVLLFIIINVPKYHVEARVYKCGKSTNNLTPEFKDQRTNNNKYI